MTATATATRTYLPRHAAQTRVVGGRTYRVIALAPQAPVFVPGEWDGQNADEIAADYAAMGAVEPWDYAADGHCDFEPSQDDAFDWDDDESEILHLDRWETV